MSQFIESIKCKNGQLYNINYHNARINLSLKAHYNINSSYDLMRLINIPKYCNKGLFKCRVVYSKTIDKVEFQSYQYRKTNTLKMVEDNEIEYLFKYTDRDRLNLLFEKREGYDDILIIKNECITDSSVANVVFFDGEEWWTPDTPLLPGTQRAFLIDTKKIFVARITPKDLNKFQYAGLINAMQGLDEISKILISNIS